MNSNLYTQQYYSKLRKYLVQNQLAITRKKVLKIPTFREKKVFEKLKSNTHFETSQ